MFINIRSNIVFIGLFFSTSAACGMAAQSSKYAASAARRAVIRMPASSAYISHPSINVSQLASMKAARRYSSGAFAGSRPSYFRATQPQFMTRKEAFEMLGVPEGSSLAQIKKVYLEKAKVFHPDMGGSLVAMKKLNEANEIAIGKTEGSNEPGLAHDFYKSTEEYEAEIMREIKDAERREKERLEKQDILFKAIRNSDLSFVEYCIDKNPGKVNTVIDDKDGSPLYYAIKQALKHDRLKNLPKESSELMIIQALLDAGANAREPELLQSTVGSIFRFGSLSKGFDLVKMLLDAGANPNESNVFGSSPLLTASWRHSPELVKMHLDAGADANIVHLNKENENMDFGNSNQLDATPLSLAIGYGEDRLQCVKLLLAAGANPNAKIRYGFKETSILGIWLVWYYDHPGDPGLLLQLNELIKAGADINIPVVDGKTVYDYALEEKDEKLVNRLRAAGARSAAEKESMWSWVYDVWK